VPTCDQPSWEILIRAIPHRHGRLSRLLAFLDLQMAPGAGVVVARDNLELSPGGKAQALLEAARADYVSFLDDDDRVAADFIPRVQSALRDHPDYVGFPVRYYVNDGFLAVIDHSLEHGSWHGKLGSQDGDPLVRDITHLNPVRRELALLAAFEGDAGEDERWADRLRATGKVRTETRISDPMYHYYYSSDDSHAQNETRLPFPGEEILPVPSYTWLRVI
jgi:hypothetical protein